MDAQGFLAGGQVSERGGEFISSEHSAIRGLADKLGLGLENTLRYPAARLVRVRRRPLSARSGGGRAARACARSPRRGGAHFEATADRVVLALTFTMLRRVDLSRAGLSARKLDAIHHLPMGTNAKLHVQFGERYWYGLGADGTTYADTGYESCWEATTAEPGRQGVLVQVHRWTHGSYSYWGPGHYTRFAGYEGVPEGTIHFAGEHTSLNVQGYMEGAVRSGRRAAREIGSTKNARLDARATRPAGQLRDGRGRGVLSRRETGSAAAGQRAIRISGDPSTGRS